MAHKPSFSPITIRQPYEDVDVVMNERVIITRLQPESVVTLVAPLLENHETYNEGIEIQDIRIVQKTIEQYVYLSLLLKPIANLNFASERLTTA
jgi:hypothetical protein